MNNPSLDQAVIETMNDLLQASSDCAEFDPAMSAKFAATAKDLGHDLGVVPARPESAAADSAGFEDDDDDDEGEFDELLHLLDLQKKAVAAADVRPEAKNRLGWLGLDIWSRW